MTARFLLARHGRSIMNAQQRVQGWADSPLDDVGRRQAQALANRLQREQPVIVYSSSLGRAKETAEVVVGALSVPLVVDERLRERDAGDVTGLTLEEMEEQFPEWVSRWREDRTVPPPGAERPSVLWGRAREVFGEIMDRHQGETVCVITHGGILRVYFSILLGMEVGRTARLVFDNCSLSAVRVTEDVPHIEMLNDTCHLKEG